MNIGQRIREARERKGLTLSDLAASIGKDKSVMSRIERGERNVKSDEVAVLAAELEVTVDHLMGVVPDRDLLAVAFRIGQQTAPGAQQQAVRMVQDVLEVEQAATLGQSVRSRERPAAIPPRTEGVPPEECGRIVAEHVRTEGGFGDAPIADLTELAEDLGVDVLRAPLPKSVSGLCVRVDGGALLAVDSEPTIGHQRFTLAHEIGHFLLDDTTQGLVLDEDSYLSKPGASEGRANAFAYELLLPERGLRRMLGNDDVTAERFAELLFHFNVSQSALRHRLRWLELISFEEWEQLKSPDFAPKPLAMRHGYFDEWAQGHQTRGQVVPPRRVWASALQAYEQGRIGLGLLAILRGQDRDELATELREQGIVPDFTGLEAGLGAAAGEA